MLKSNSNNSLSNRAEVNKQPVKYSNTYNSSIVPPSCRIDLNPQQTKFTFGDIVIDSQFDSGNMQLAEKVNYKPNFFHIWVSPDCFRTQSRNNYRSWYHFRASGVPAGETVTFRMKNLGSQGKLYREGHLPVFKSSLTNKWERIRGGPIDNTMFVTEERNLEVSFSHKFTSPDEKVQFAFTYPWSYQEGMEMIDKYEQELKDDPEIYFHRTCLIQSREFRRVELVTISDHSNKLNEQEKKLNNCYPFPEEKRPQQFQNKKYVFFSARVHPGELPGSHVFNGIFKFLLQKDDKQAKILRENFVFCLVPFLNPDGVYRGHYRTDTSGINLNRFYLYPSLNEHPSIYAIRELILNLNSTSRLHAYIDLHAHASRRGCFMFGNCSDLKRQVEICLFPRIIALNSDIFEYEGCNFTEKNMYAKDKGDGLSKEGAGRVALFKQTKIPLCYTVECNYNTGLITNQIKQKSTEPIDMKVQLGNYDKDIIRNFMNLEPQSGCRHYAIEDYESLGEEILISILDYNRINPYSRIPFTKYQSYDNLKLHLSCNLMKINPHKKDPYIRRLSRVVQHVEKYDQGLKHLQLFLEKGIKTDPMKEIQNPQQENQQQQSMRVKRGTIRKYSENLYSTSQQYKLRSSQIQAANKLQQQQLTNQQNNQAQPVVTNKNQQNLQKGKTFCDLTNHVFDSFNNGAKPGFANEKENFMGVKKQNTSLEPKNSINDNMQQFLMNNKIEFSDSDISNGEEEDQNNISINEQNELQRTIYKKFEQKNKQSSPQFKRGSQKKLNQQRSKQDQDQPDVGNTNESNISLTDSESEDEINNMKNTQYQKQNILQQQQIKYSQNLQKQQRSISPLSNQRLSNIPNNNPNLKVLPISSSIQEKEMHRYKIDQQQNNNSSKPPLCLITSYQNSSKNNDYFPPQPQQFVNQKIKQQQQLSLQYQQQIKKNSLKQLYQNLTQQANPNYLAQQSQKQQQQQLQYQQLIIGQSQEILQPQKNARSISPQNMRNSQQQQVYNKPMVKKLNFNYSAQHSDNYKQIPNTSQVLSQKPNSSTVLTTGNSLVEQKKTNNDHKLPSLIKKSSGNNFTNLPNQNNPSIIGNKSAIQQQQDVCVKMIVRDKSLGKEKEPKINSKENETKIIKEEAQKGTKPKSVQVKRSSQTKITRKKQNKKQKNKTKKK